jgi:pimeloyl-ACP methyl ester carboxylesterase
VGLAAWGPATSGIRVPTLLLYGSNDTPAPCSASDGAYRGAATPKMQVNIDGATHFSWFGPADAGGGTSGKYALAFQKVFLEGDQRWRPLLDAKVAGATVKAALQ